MPTDSAYFVSPSAGPGRGVLLLHSWWGLNGFFRRLADRLSDEGYTVLAPDLNFGEVFEDAEEAREHLEEADADRLAGLTLAAAQLLREKTSDPGAPVAVVGFSMGASLGLWASVRIPDVIGSVAAFYGSQSIDFAGSRSEYQLHLAETDAWVDSDEAVFMEATIGLVELPVEVHQYPGTEHWFFEEGVDTHHPEAAELAWNRLVGFLDRTLTAAS
jgi:carboxymethylenebutenolidase